MKKIIGAIAMLLILAISSIAVWTGQPPEPGQLGQPYRLELTAECSEAISAYNPATLTLKLWRPLFNNSGVFVRYLYSSKTITTTNKVITDGFDFIPDEKGYWTLQGDMTVNKKVRVCSGITCTYKTITVKCFRNSLSGYVGLCGDGVIDESETCDDGNIVNSDGCNQYCQTE